MAKRKTNEPSKEHPERRPRAEIDRNFLLGDVFIKTGAACGVALLLIAAYTPFTLEGAIQSRMYDYLAVIGCFAALGVLFYLAGRHLRHEATHWDFD